VVPIRLYIAAQPGWGQAGVSRGPSGASTAVGDQRGVVQEAVLGVQDDVGGEAPCAEPGQLGGEHHAHGRRVTVDGQRWRLDRIVAPLSLDVVGHHVDRHVLAKVVAGDLHHAVVGRSPRAGRRPIAAGDDHRPRARENLLGRKPSGTLSANASTAAMPTTRARPAFRPTAFDLRGALARRGVGGRRVPLGRAGAAVGSG
jgi:hypothetical protein